MYSYAMLPDTTDLQALIAKAESGETEVARNGLRKFIQRHPSTLLAWKWLADIAENARERSGAIRRAQLLAPGDPWVIEAKKHRLPPARRSRKPNQPTAAASDTAASTAPAETVTEKDAESETITEKHAGPVDKVPSHSGNKAADENVSRSRGKIQVLQPRWAIWVAAAMGVAGLALLATAWQLGSF